MKNPSANKLPSASASQRKGGEVMPDETPNPLAFHKLIEASRNSLGESQAQILERMSKELWKRTTQSKTSPPAGVSSVGSIQSKTKSMGSIPNELNRQDFSKASIEKVTLKIKEKTGLTLARKEIGKTRKFFDTSNGRVCGIVAARPSNTRERIFWLDMRKLDTIDAIFLYLEKSPDEAFTFVLAGGVLTHIFKKVSVVTKQYKDTWRFYVYEESPTAWYLGFSGDERYYLTGSKAPVDTLENYDSLMQ